MAASDSGSTPDARPSPRVHAGGLTTARASLLAFVGSLLVYVLDVLPSIGDNDTAEFQAIGVAGGIPHAPGYPLVAMISRLFGLLPIADGALRINLMSSFFGACTMAMMVLVGGEIGLAPVWSLAAAMVFGSTVSFWCAALRAEVYTLSTTVFLLALLWTLIALRTRRYGHALLAGVLLGLVATGEPASAAIVMLLGLVLAWFVLRNGRQVVPRLVGLAAAFVAGLTPYLYLVWLDGTSAPVNYLTQVRQVVSAGRETLPPELASSFRAVRWLMLSGNVYGHAFAHPSLKSVARGLIDMLADLGLFEFGPILILMVPVGVSRLLRERTRWGGLLLAAIALDLVFIAAVGYTLRVSIFLLPCNALITFVAVYGLSGLLAGARAGALARGVPFVLALVVVLMIPPHLLRVVSQSHPIPPGHWACLGEAGEPLQVIPRLHDPYADRRLGEAIMRTIPRDGLVLAEWRERPILYFLRFAEGRRADLDIRPLSYPEMLPGLWRWQHTHDLAQRPIVFVTFPAELRRHVTDAESLEVDAAHWLHVARHPLRDLPAPVEDPRR